MGDLRMRTPERTDFLACILTDTVESGAIDYWAEIEDYAWGASPPSPALTSASCKVREFDTSPENPEWMFLGLDEIEWGITLILEGKVTIAPELYNDIAGANFFNDASMLDAMSGDCIVQAALLEELVYG